MNPSRRLDRETYLGHVRADVDRTAALVAGNPLDTPVESCPGWDLGALAIHLGNVHRWVVQCVTTAQRPTSADHRPLDGSDAAATATWLRDGAARMIDVLSSADESAATWHPFPVERVVGIWPRRQAVENVVHRVDAETAVDARTPIDPALASDGIDEYFELVLPRLVSREGRTLPAGSLHVHCTDVAGEWLVQLRDDRLDVRREHAKGDAAVRGPAAAVLLRLWNRAVEDDAGIEIVGDRDVAAAWLGLSGL